MLRRALLWLALLTQVLAPSVAYAQTLPNVPLVVRAPVPGLKVVLPAVNGAYDTDAQAAFAAMTVQPDKTHKDALDLLIRGLKADASWVQIDWLQIPAIHDGQAGRLNLRNPSQIALMFGGMTFTVDRGWLGNGSDGYFTMGDSQASGAKYTGPSAFVYTYVNGGTTADSTAVTWGGPINGVTSFFRPRQSGAFNGRLNNSGNQGFGGTATTTYGSRAATKITTPSSQLIAFVDGAVSNTINGPDSATSTGLFQMLRLGTGTPTNFQVAVVAYGGELTVSQLQSMDSRFKTYLNTVGGM